GPHEERAPRFQRAVLRTLDGSTPVLGVVQDAKSAFLEQVKCHPKVELIAVTPENRDELAEFWTHPARIISRCRLL
ncbi:MAG TPA: nucleoside-triphosphatase, partial [Clostridia bacterium]|nr:nucleoside-triphosphatase [Clostridia bacterium]